MGAQRLSILSGSIASHDGRTVVRAGWFDPQQVDRFVFAQPAVVSSLPSLVPPIGESIGDGPPQLAAFPSTGGALPLHGIDLMLGRGDATYEALDAALPSLPGTSARMTMATFGLDHHNGTRLSAQVLRASTGGAAVTSTTFFGTPPTIVASAQGPLPYTTLEGQQQTIAGVRGAFSLDSRSDAALEIGRAFYHTAPTASGITSGNGGFYHAGYHRRFGAIDANIDGYRFEPRYGTLFLPYGTPENIWSVAYSWPASWLKGAYQLADNATIGVNRQGARVRVAARTGAVTARVSYAAYNQIEPLDVAHGTQGGFVEGYYLPQISPLGGTLGYQKQYALWIDYKTKVAELIGDLVDDTQHRDATPAHPLEAVSIEYPQYTFGIAKNVGERLLITGGIGRYALYGSYSNSGAPNANLAQRVTFAGFEYRFSPGNVVHVQYRAYATGGIPTVPNGPSPAYTGGQLLIEQRVRL